MVKDVQTVSSEDSVDVLFNYKLSSLPVLDGDKLVGVITYSRTIIAYYNRAKGLNLELDAVINSAYNAIISVDVIGNIRTFNPSAEKLFGITRENATLNKINKIIGSDVFNEVLTQQKSILNHRISFMNTSVYMCISCIFGKHGEVVGAVAIFQDYTEIDKLNIELYDERAIKYELDAIIDSSYDGIMVTDDCGVITRVNASLLRILKLSSDAELVGNQMNIFDSIIGRDLFSIVKDTETHYTDRFIFGESDLIITANPKIKGTQKFDGVIINVRDMTKLKSLETQMTNLNELYNKEIIKSDIINKYVFQSPDSRKLLMIALQVANVDSTVLIYGESGVGKEAICDIIYSYGHRNTRPLIKINCGAIPDTLLEAELFGYEEGSFTGALKHGKIGFFEAANGGVLFLDEIAEIPIQLQVKLLRAITEKEIQRIGGRDSRCVDVRIIAATNRNLLSMVKEGTFRADLYYRINVIPIEVLPLRDRKEDIVGLSTLFLSKFNEKYGYNKRISNKAMSQLSGYRWPGNIRELENVIERAVVTGDTVVIDSFDISDDANAFAIQWNKNSYKDHVNAFEEMLIKNALKKYGSTRNIAKNMHLDQSTIVKKAARLGIKLR
jgi:PAS domain S-box-containing protein